MNRRNIIVVLLVLFVVTAAFWALRERRPVAVSKPASSPFSTTAPVEALLNTPAPSPASVQKPGGPFEPRDPRWQWWNENIKRDPGFQWRMPIEFYGKVVDEKEQPVQGAKLQIVGTDDSPSGNFFRTLFSDANGMVALKGLHGKGFGVLVAKDGYYASGTNPRSFEYAAFSNPDYYQPDPSNPVIFHLRKKGKPAPLASLESEVVTTFGSPSKLSMPPAAGSVFPITVTVFENDLPKRTWKARIAVDGGGVQPALEEFPFEAPEDGYESSIDVDQTSPRSPSWREIGQGGLYYFKSPEGYGLLKLQQMKGKRTLHYSVLLNTQGGRNLEPAQ